MSIGWRQDWKFWCKEIDEVNPPLFLLPGMGGDERLFEGHQVVRDVRTIRWIPPRDSSETLHGYAARLAHKIQISEPFDLGGSSFGGMVALELARHLSPRCVFLFGSCRSPRSVAPALRAARWLEPVLPDRLLGPPRLMHPLIARWFGATSPAHMRLFADMLDATPIAFVRWASKAVFSWAGVPRLPVPIHHIHGERDRLIPARRVNPDRIVPGAGHLLNLTHAEAVNDFIRQVGD